MARGGVKLINSLLSASAAPHLYYIFVYIQFSLLTPLLGKLAKSRYQFIGWLIAPISVLFFHYFLSQRSPNGLFRVFWDNACLGWFSFYYLGLILGNRILVKEYSLKILITLYVLSLLIQMGEAYGWKIMGVINCGSQLNITALLSSSLFCLIAYTVLEQKKLNVTNKIALFIKKLGDYSFGIYLSHIMILNVLWNYRNVLPYPLNSLTILLLSLFLCYIGTIVLGRKKSRLLGLQ